MEKSKERGAEISKAHGPEILAFKISTTALKLSVSESSVRKLIKRGELKAIRKLRHPLITRESIERFLNSGGSSR